LKLINYLLTARGVGAIFLINNDGIGDLIHENVFKYKIGSFTEGWSSPCFDSHSIRSAAKGAVFYENSINIVSVVFTEAPDAYSMPRSTKNLRNIEVSSSGQNGYTVIAGTDCGTRDCDVVGASDFNPIGVGAIGRSRYSDMTYIHIPTTEYHDMAVLTVDGPQVMNPRVGHKIKSYCLHAWETGCMR
jgi:hypothetical protein